MFPVRLNWILRMTFKKSFFLSMFTHLALIGSALLFVQHARGISLPLTSTVQVTLVAPGLGAEQQNNSHSNSERKHVTPRRQGQSDVKSAMPDQVNEHKTNTEIADVLPQETDNRHEQPGLSVSGSEDGDGPSNSWASNSGGSTGIHAISSEQWALIEAAIERTKNYPRLARERGIQGVTLVRFKLKPSGDVESTEILKSSGSEILDAASIRTVYNAAPMPYVHGWIEVPMAYVLK